MVYRQHYGLAAFVLSGALAVSVTSAQTFHFVNTSMNWTRAQSVCRTLYTDLATIENTAHLDAIASTTSDYAGKAWIGLYDDLENSWRWSLNDSSFYGEGETTFRNWFSFQPNNLGGQQYCVELFSGSPYLGTWGDSDCTERRNFVCYSGTVDGTATFVKVEELFNYNQAQKFCRENYVDLASIRNLTENKVIRSLAGGSFVWIGLRRDKVWSDGSGSPFRHWSSRQPDSGEQRCVAAAFSDSGQWSDEDCSLHLPSICHSTAPQIPENFRSVGQNETSITLQWNKVNSNVRFILQFNGTETSISAPHGDGPVTHTVSSLFVSTKYTFTLFSVFENVKTSGVSITAVTAPPNPENFRSAAQNETSITLQWNKVNSNVSFILQFNGTETSISAPHGDGPVTHTVSSLTAAAKYTFTLFSVFENVRSSGVSITAVTASRFIVGLNMTLKSDLQLSQSDLLHALEVLFRSYGLSPEFLSLRVRCNNWD